VFLGKIFLGAGYSIACNHLHTGSLHISRAQACSPVSNLSNSIFISWCPTFHRRKAPNNARPPDTACAEVVI